MTIAAVIVAAGRGLRAGAGPKSLPKQYQSIGGKPVLRHALDAFAHHPLVAECVAVIHADDVNIYQSVICDADAQEGLQPPVVGGATRQISVCAGLEHLAARPNPPEIVLIHDAARPHVTADIISRVIGGLDVSDAAIAALSVVDALQRTDASGRITDEIDREHLWRAQTPQAFRFSALLSAHRKASQAGHSAFRDDASLFRWAGGTVTVVPGSERNVKLTTEEDMAMAIGRGQSSCHRLRTGSGYDVHRTGPGDHVWLCGVQIPAPFSLVGHSDADVGLHAATDALLGALGDGDIGSHFPPSDPQWAGAPSKIFLADAADRIRRQGGSINNIDVTLICELPKIGPWRQQMCAQMAEILAVSISRISIKATTSEGLGFTGRGEGIAAMAAATITLPDGAA